MKTSSFFTAVLLGCGVVIMTMAIGSVTAPQTVQPSPKPTGHGLIIAEQRPPYEDCLTEDSPRTPGKPCVWDTWLRGDNPTPGRLPRYVIVWPEAGK